MSRKKETHKFLAEDIVRLLDPELQEIEEQFHAKIGEVLGRVGQMMDATDTEWEFIHDLELTYIGLMSEELTAAFLKGLEYGANPVKMFASIQENYKVYGRGPHEDADAA